MKTIVLFVFTIAMAIALCSSSSIGSSSEIEESLKSLLSPPSDDENSFATSDEVEGPVRSARGFYSCRWLWLSLSKRNSNCNTYCRGLSGRRGGYCSKTLICTCYR
ncbi:CLUMA_CG007773, isoform A [Clunio marinus]|uniref:CLUMA_CG007773, isoform A n=1 Tax=Clunio marinus TaxID=568069 RepID=A0A1J1I3A5_9DIPT|nr:CLUMA_CG007773, isoform A [Clunio marinus]